MKGTQKRIRKLRVHMGAKSDKWALSHGAKSDKWDAKKV